jgi:hypothetical protein
MIRKVTAWVHRTRRAQTLRGKLDEWITIQESELSDADLREAEGMEAALEAYEAVRHYLNTGHEPLLLHPGR